MNTFILLGCIQLFRSDSKDIFVMLQIIYISSKCWSFELSIHQRILNKCIFKKYQAAQLFSTLIIRNVWAAVQHVRINFWRIMWHWRLE